MNRIRGAVFWSVPHRLNPRPDRPIRTTLQSKNAVLMRIGGALALPLPPKPD